MKDYRLEFQNKCPKSIMESSPQIIAEAYDLITEYYQKTGELEEEARELNNLETLFDMQKSSYKDLRDCRIELVQLKQMWDLVALIDF